MKLVQPELPGVVSVERAAEIVFSSWTEDDLARYVRNMAKTLGYRLYHTRYSIGSDPGFPDCVISRPSRVIFAELKKEGKWPTTTRFRGRRQIMGQTDWMRDLLSAAECYLWWPSDSADIAEILQHGQHPDMPCVRRLREWLAKNPRLA